MPAAQAGPNPIHPPTGSPKNGEPVFLVVGKLGRPHGLAGEINLTVMTDFPERLTAGKIVYLGERKIEATIRTSRRDNARLLLAFTGIDDRSRAEALRNQLVFVKSSEVPPLDPGELYIHQLIGLRVVLEDGNLLGRVSEILNTGANDVYVVRTESGQEILLPAIDQVILGVDVQSETMRVRPLPGLLP